MKNSAITPDMIERGAKAIQSAVSRGLHRTRAETEDPFYVDRRWKVTPALSQERYRNEARACLEAALNGADA